MNLNAISTLDPDTRETVTESLGARGEEAIATIVAPEEAGVGSETAPVFE